MNKELFQEFLAKEVFGNTAQAYLVSLCVFFGFLVGLRIFKVMVIHRLRQYAKTTTSDIDDFLVQLLDQISPLVYFFLPLYVATRSLTLNQSLAGILHTAFVIVLTVKAIHVLQAVSTFFLNRWASKTEEDDLTNAMVVRNVSKVLNIVLWVVGIIFILDNVGVNIASIVAGLGVGGIAVALAAQSILGDAFSGFLIFVDKPFKAGDFIIVGDLLGTVEHIGFKTTRIRSLHGEQLIFSNTDLTSSRIRNYKRMETRRILFKIGVIYQTPLEKLKTIPKMIENIVQENKLAKFDRAHFQSYGDFALIYEIVYYVLTADYNQYMDVQHFINVRIKEEFEKAGIEFAYPTQQLFVTQVGSPQ